MKSRTLQTFPAFVVLDFLTSLRDLILLSLFSTELKADWTDDELRKSTESVRRLHAFNVCVHAVHKSAKVLSQTNVKGTMSNMFKANKRNIDRNIQTFFQYIVCDLQLKYKTHLMPVL